jgi:hypothetical protein
MEVTGQRHDTAVICPGEMTPGTHCTGGWVGLSADLENSFASVGDRTPFAR